MYIITMNTLKFLHSVQEVTITDSSFMVTGKWMRLCKASRLVLAQENQTSKENC